jgi:hypothetical protein
MLEQRLGDEQLLALLGRAAARLGRQAALAEPSDEHFPEDYEPNLVVAGELLHRLMAYAGLGDRELEVVDGRAPDRPLRMEELEVTHPDVSFLESDGKKLIFQITRLGPADVTLAALAQEVARAALAVASQRNGAHPYRSGPEAPSTPDDEALVAAATVWLGFGLITLPAAISFRRSSVATGYSVTTRQTIMLTSGLPSGDLAFLLAAWMVVRDQDETAIVREYLVKEQAENVEEWICTLRSERLELLEKLGLSHPFEAPCELPPVRPLDVSGFEQLEARHGKANLGRTVERKWERRTLTYALLGFAVSLIPAAILAQWIGGFIVVLLVIGFFAGIVIGSSRRRHYCGACQMPLRSYERQCPQCGARFQGESELVRIARTMDDLDDEEDEALAREALGLDEDQASDDEEDDAESDESDGISS